MTRIIIIEPRYDSTGKLIQEHDVLKDIQTGEIALVVRAKNKSGVIGLAVENQILGTGDWLDVYPNGVWTIVGNKVTNTYYLIRRRQQLMALITSIILDGREEVPSHLTTELKSIQSSLNIFRGIDFGSDDGSWQNQSEQKKN
ncbi:hypothetical protein [Bacillus sp. Hm123]|uniref:hypothetical protein n=1 Tax=Bacillus sp. Hm123 TaxID=3450745 RepID=UPI003F422E5F